jgi:hypothetical protein
VLRLVWVAEVKREVDSVAFRTDEELSCDVEDCSEDEDVDVEESDCVKVESGLDEAELVENRLLELWAVSEFVLSVDEWLDDVSVNEVGKLELYKVELVSDPISELEEALETEELDWIDLEALLWGVCDSEMGVEVDDVGLQVGQRTFDTFLRCLGESKEIAKPDRAQYLAWSR